MESVHTPEPYVGPIYGRYRVHCGEHFAQHFEDVETASAALALARNWIDRGARGVFVMDNQSEEHLDLGALSGDNQ